MKNFLAGKDVSVDVLFQSGMDTVIPDVDTVTYSLYSNAGVALISDASVTTGPDTTQIAIIVLAANNGIGSNNFEYRTVVVTYEIDGGTRQQRYQYRLVPFINLSVSPDDVRALVGFSKNELPDEDIDLITAYFEVKDMFPTTELADALAASNTTTFAAQTMIICEALIDLLPGFQFRVLQSAKSNTSSFLRVSKLDFDALISWLYGLLGDAYDVIVPPGPSDPSLGLLLAVSHPTLDPVTAAAPA